MDNLIKMSYSTLKNVGRGVILLCFLCYLLLIYFYSSLRSEVADAVFKNVDSSVLVHSKAWQRTRVGILILATPR